jgi:predicted esterase
MPVVVTTGGRDALVPPESVLRLTGVLKKLGREVLVIHRPEGGHETNYADAQAALDYVLKRACSKRE